MQHANNDLTSEASLQRGARYYVNYCLGCHSARYVRYSRIGTDLGITTDQLIENLMFTADKPQRTMEIASMLYGISLNHDGTTKVVAQRLEHPEGAADEEARREAERERAAEAFAAQTSADDEPVVAVPDGEVPLGEPVR